MFLRRLTLFITFRKTFSKPLFASYYFPKTFSLSENLFACVEKPFLHLFAGKFRKNFYSYLTRRRRENLFTHFWRATGAENFFTDFSENPWIYRKAPPGGSMPREPKSEAIPRQMQRKQIQFPHPLLREWCWEKFVARRR